MLTAHLRSLTSLLRGPVEPRQRRVAAATLISFVGTGIYFGAGAVYLTRSAGLRPSEVALGLTIGGTVGLAAGILLGDQADRRGAREVVVACMLIQAVGACLLLAVDGVISLAVAATVATIGGAGAGSGRGAIIGIVAGEGESSKLRSYLRAVTNVGLAVGTIGAAVVLAIDTRAAYATMLLLDAGTFVIGALIIAGIGYLPPTRSAGAAASKAVGEPGRWLALRDVRYLTLTLAASVASLQYFVLTLALPLWVTLHTSAPRWSPAVLFLAAAVLVAALQVPATRSIDGPRSAGRLIARSGPVFIVAWLLFAEASTTSAVGVALGLLGVGIVLHSLAEVWQAAGAFELSFTLAKPEAHGQYQGVFGLSHGVAEAVAPLLVIGLCVNSGRTGWLVLGAIVCAAGLVCAGIERFGHRERCATITAA
jgi:MFS family permease